MRLDNMGVRLCVFTVPMLGQEAALDVSRVQIGPPDEAVETYSTQLVASGCCHGAEYMDAWIVMSRLLYLLSFSIDFNFW